MIVIHQPPHHLSHAQAGMRVIHLHRNFRGKIVKVVVLEQVSAHDVMQRAGDEEVFLNEAKFFA